MGIDALDMIFRLEKSFAVKIDKGFWDRIPQGEIVEPASWWSCDRFVRRSSNPKWRYERAVPVVTAGDVHTVVCAILTEKGMVVPSDSWPRVRAVLSDVTGHAVDEITPQSRLFDDLGFA
jgi:acyl carrier protein